MILVKIHESEDRKIIAICDKKLIGKNFEDKDLQLNITKRFYEGEPLTEDQTVELIKDAFAVNIVGEESINLALKNKLISERNIIKIKGVPHAQIC